jgi:DNA-binding GntR family transcriptional regulator
LYTTKECIKLVPMTDSNKPQQMADRIVDAILAQKLAPGARLGEQQLADLFGVSRTIVREALARLAARGMVEVNPRRGWFVVQPSPDAAREAFAARQVIETGLLQSLPGQLDAAAIKRLKQHVAQEKAAVAAADAGQRSFLLGDFHVCLAECAGNSTLADILRDLTARTTLIATLYQSNHEAAVSCQEHAQIVAALARGENAAAIKLMRQHIHNVSAHLSPTASDPLESLRTALTPLDKQANGPAQPLHTTVPSKRPTRRLFTALVATPTPPHPEKRR